MSRLTNLYIKWAEKHNINYNTLTVLYILKMEKDLITQKQISYKYQIPKQTVNNVIKALNNDGYVTLVTEEKDKREKKIFLSEKGLEFSKELLFPLFEIEERVVRKIGDEMTQQLINSLSTFGDVFEQEMR
ncbi:MarR family winged helix-turn-helix transcriptional regulator [Desulfitobacterium hafniense]|nr:MarR family transcriptional regulator [Desulfitobacterium hafniense]